MASAHEKTTRSGLSLTEVLIGIMILGIGVISLATLFPVGLLRLKRAVGDTRSVYAGRIGHALADAGGLTHPPLGPIANAFIADPLDASGSFDPATAVPPAGPGIPVVIDPLGVLSHGEWSATPDYPTWNQGALNAVINRKRLGYLVVAGTPISVGLPRFKGEYLSTIWRAFGVQQARREALALFADSGDLLYWDNQKRVPLQTIASPANPPQFLQPTNGVPFRARTMLREARYTWFAIVQKISARQLPAVRWDRVSNDADNVADLDEWHYPGVDGQYGPIGLDSDADGIDDGVENDVPVGPFRVTVVVVYRRAFGTETTVPFVFPVGPDGAPGVLNQDDDGDGVTDFLAPGVPDPEELAWPGSDDSPPSVIRIPLPDPTGLAAVAVPRADQVPEIARDGYVMDATYQFGAAGPRHAFWYRVRSRERVIDPQLGPVLRLTLDGPVQHVMAEGAAAPGVGSLVIMKGVVGVFETVVK